MQHAGHDVATVLEQALTSATDADLIRLCMEEGRALVTLDLDFANPLRFRPSLYAGIAVLRLPDKPSDAQLTKYRNEVERVTEIPGYSTPAISFLMGRVKIRSSRPVPQVVSTICRNRAGIWASAAPLTSPAINPAIKLPSDVARNHKPII